jgi:cell wall-associated protease
MMTAPKLFTALVLFACVGCSKHHNDFIKAMNKKDPKGHVPEKVFTLQNLKQKNYDNWFTQDPELDQKEGTSADKAYENLDLKHEKEIIVAVIDSGVDVYHEDLKGKIWINAREIAANGIDDDGNGYIDDIYGWNFIGGYDENGNPTHIDQEQLEVTRELIKMKAKKKALEDQGLSLSEKELAYYNQLSEEVHEATKDAIENVKILDGYLSDLQKNYEIIKELLSVPFEQMTLAQVKSLKPTVEAQIRARKNILNIFDKGKVKDVARILRVKSFYDGDLKYYYNEDFKPREKIVKDDPENFLDAVYGNNDVIGPGADHGTHVAGIIAANRDNDLGIRGIAKNVKIMVLRAVPDGDERDKDVALAVKYAADNGAHIINMSFGKSYSPQKIQVSEAFKYAEEKGLIILHAAGNESTDRDQEDRFPTRNVYNEKEEVVETISTWLDVGASGQFHDRTLTATFTNYGQKTVDLFAPGVGVVSTIPDNKYASFNGTSMACPAAAGVAALVWSEMSQLSAYELKARLMSTARSRAGLLVRLPSDHKQDVPFETLSIAGGIADVYSALTQ